LNSIGIDRGDIANLLGNYSEANKKWVSAVVEAQQKLASHICLKFLSIGMGEEAADGMKGDIEKEIRSIKDTSKNVIENYVANQNFIDMIIDFMEVNNDGLIKKKEFVKKFFFSIESLMEMNAIDTLSDEESLKRLKSQIDKILSDTK